MELVFAFKLHDFVHSLTCEMSSQILTILAYIIVSIYVHAPQSFEGTALNPHVFQFPSCRVMPFGYVEQGRIKTKPTWLGSKNTKFMGFHAITFLLLVYE